jgi:HK97 family phage portal protein
MSFWDKIKNIFTTKSDPQQIRYFMVPARHAGVVIDHDSALKFSAVFRAIAFISQTIACLPWMVIREREESKTKLPGNPIAGLLHQRPNPEMSAFSFRETMVAWALSWGNGFAEIETDGAGRPIALWPISPDRVQVKRNRETMVVEYEVNNYYGGTTYLSPAQIFHLHGLGFDGLVGYSVISLAARSIGLSIAAETCGEDFFSNGLVSTGYLKMPGKLSPERTEKIALELKERFTGAGKRWVPPVFQEGMDWGNMSMRPEDAQMLQTRDFQVSDIARWFGLPPHKLAQLVKTSYASIEMQSIEVVNDALLPWVVRLEQEANYKLFRGQAPGLYTKLNLTSLLRGDNKSRGEFYQMMRNIGVYSANDILRLEDLDPIGPEGDARIVPLNYTTLEKLVNGEVARGRPGIDMQQARASYLVLFEAAEKRILGRESGQFNQIFRKLQDKSEDYQDWSSRFFARHREYMAGVLEPLVFSLAALVAPVAETNGNLSSVIETFIEAHIRDSSAVFLAALEQGNCEINLTRAKQNAEALIEQVLTCVSLLGAGHEKLVQH